MKRKTLSAVLALLVLASVLSGCAAAPEAAPTPELTPALPEGAVAVSTVDELLAALAPNAVIVLREGDYDLSTASDYGTEDLRGAYRWELVYGGCQLVISDVPGLQLIAQGAVNILATPRYAEVLSFRSCWDLKLEGLTLGHTQEPGGCSAGVLNLYDCDNVTVEGCRLFGCGSMGVTASNSRAVTVRGTTIDACSDGAVNANSCRDLRLEDCTLRDCGLSQIGAGSSLVYTEHCAGFALVNCEITGNRVYQLLQNQWSSQVYLLGCRVENNRVLGSVFLLEGRSVTVDKCAFKRRSDERYYTGSNALFAKGADGEELISFDLDHMELARAEYDGPAEPEPVQMTRPENQSEVHVSTVDELLAAIAPDTCIVLEAGVYDLSTASDYGGAGGAWYYWEQCYDGYALCLSDISGLWICGVGRDNTLVSAKPRYADVFSFRNCENVGLSDLTAGHSEEPGYCAGNVLGFAGCRAVSVENCGLFGCGVIGINAWNCDSLLVQGTEIYECSAAAATLDNCMDVSFIGCSIYDCDDGNNVIQVFGSTVDWNGETLLAGIHLFDRERYSGRLS